MLRLVSGDESYVEEICKRISTDGMKPTAECSHELCRACSTLTSSASAARLLLLASSTLSAASSSARCMSTRCRDSCAILTWNRYWGTSETLLPVYQDPAKAMAKHTDVDTVVNFASSRSVYSSTMELMKFPQIKTIAIIAEGVPERVGPPLCSANM